MTQENHDPEPKSKKALSRGELLKALTAMGGAVAASSMLPAKWSKPEVGAGALPAHAQGTLLFDCWLDDPVYEGGTFLFQFLTIPPTPGLSVILEVIVDGLSGFLGPLLTGADGRINGNVIFPCGTAGVVYRQIWWDATQTQIYCQSGPVTVQPNLSCNGESSAQSPPSVETHIEE